MSSKPAVLLFLFIATVASLTAAFPSNCLNFEQGDYVEGTGLPTTAYSGITIEAWVRHSDLTGTAQRYITVKPELAVLRMNGGSLHFYVKQSDGTLEGLTADVLATDEWLHVAGTYDGANLKLYLNGVLVAGDTATVGGFYTPTGEFDISANGESMHGCIDEVRLWNVVRTQAQIQANRFAYVSTTSSGLVAYWKLDSSSGATAADAMGAANGTLYNMSSSNWLTSTVPVVTANAPGRALSFDGTDNHVVLNKRSGLPIYNSGTAYSVSMWVKGDAQTGSCLYRECDPGAGGGLSLITTGAGKVQVDIRSSGSTYQLIATSQTTVFDGAWHHICWVDNNGAATMYIDGVADGTNFNYTRSSSFTITDARLGCMVSSGGTNSAFYTGQMDEVSFWKIALTEAQVNRYLHGTKTVTTSGLAAYYQMNESSGDVAYDVVNGNNGLLNNFASTDHVTSTAPINTVHGGSVTTDATWSGTSYIYSDVTINSGVTLTISPGATLYFQNAYSITVQGDVQAIGNGSTSTNINFTGREDIGWRGFILNNVAAGNDSTRMKYCNFEYAYNDLSGAQGSALCLKNSDMFRATRCAFTNCRAGGTGSKGGAVYLENSDAKFYNCTFDDNSVTGNGGAFYLSNAQPTLFNCLIRGNSATGNGGGIYFFNGGNPSLINCQISGNSAVNGGGLYGNNGGGTVMNCGVFNNTATTGGGGFYGAVGTYSVTQRNTFYWDNTAPTGSQVCASGAAQNVSFYYCDIQGGQSGFGSVSGGSFTGAYSHCFSLNPQLIVNGDDPVGYSSTSPLINAGDPASPTIITWPGTKGLHDWSRFYDDGRAAGSMAEALDRIDVGPVEAGYTGLNALIPDGAVIDTDFVSDFCCYIVHEGRTLTINPGVTITNGYDSGFEIYGSLIAVGTAEQPINLVEKVNGSQHSTWKGLRFFNNGGADRHSQMEYCNISGARADADNLDSTSDGGGIYLFFYDELTMRNCKITNCRYTENGGGICAYNSMLTLIGCVISGCSATGNGGGLFFSDCEVTIAHCTIAGNTAATAGGLYFQNLYDQPEIIGCIFWGNGPEPIYSTDGDLTNISYSDVEGGYAGTDNGDFDPQFCADGDDPYNIEAWSYALNAAEADTAGLNLGDTDLLGNPRVHAHSFSTYNRIDMGAYEYPGMMAPSEFSASDGDSNYGGYVYLSWSYNPLYSPPPSGFRIFRNGVSIDVADGDVYSYSDESVSAGVVYSYYVRAYNGNEYGDTDVNSGYVKPNGIITGTVLTPNDNPVAGVRISLSPNTGACVECDGDNASLLTISDPGTNMNADFTLELWARTLQTNVVLLRRGDQLFGIDADGHAAYTDSIHTITQTGASIADHDWHHLALVNDAANNVVKLYLDGELVAADSTFSFTDATGGNITSSTAFTGWLDDIRIWSVARDSADIVAYMNMVAPFDATGLDGYWGLNENTGADIFDGTNYNHHGTLSNCAWSTSDPDIELGAFTDDWGEYTVTQITYGSSTTFTVSPGKTGHAFHPQSRQVTLNTSNIAQNGIDFTDNSVIPITGVALYQGTVCPLSGATIYLNGSPASPGVSTNDDGEYTLEVEHGTACVVSLYYNGHPMNREWNLGAVTSPKTDVNFFDTCKTNLQVEVVGGKDAWPIGSFDITLASADGLYTLEDTGENWATGVVIVDNIPPLEYNVTVNPGDNDPFDLVTDDQFQSDKTQAIDLTLAADGSIDTLSYVWNAPMQMSVAWPDSCEYKHFAAYPQSEFFVLTQNEWCEATISVCEDYSYTGHEDQTTWLDDCILNINDEVGSRGATEAVFDSIAYVYRFAPYLPCVESGYDRQYQNSIEFTVWDAAQERSLTQTYWVLTEGARPQEGTYATTSPDIPFIILHDPPGDGSYATFSETSSQSTSYGIEVASEEEDDGFLNIHLGLDIQTSTGLFFSMETEVDVTADVNMDWTTSTSQTTSKEKTMTMTTTEEYSTSDADDIIGDGADVFIGGALNLLWGVTKEVAWDDEAQDVVTRNSIMVTPDGFATRYIYTANQITESVIPNLIAIGDTASANLWQSFLDENEENKAQAVANSNHPANFSFNAGVGYTYTEENTTSSTSVVEFDTTVSSEYGFEIGATVNGIGSEGGYTYRTRLTKGKSVATTEENTTTISYTLADDDITSALNQIGDYFSVDVKTDPVYGTPVFNLVSGASSCPWEPNTQPRDGVTFSANTYTVSNIAGGNDAVFLLYLGNTSQTDEDRRYYLCVDNATNTMGATVKINGVALEGAMAFDVPAGQAAQAVMTVTPGPVGYELEGLTLEFYAEGDRGNDGPTDHYFDVFKSFNIYWEAPYSRVSIYRPEDNWLVNQAANNTLEVILKDYDLTKEDFRSVKLEYRRPSDANWLPAAEIFRDTLEAYPRYYTLQWDVSGLADGAYQIRAATTDSVQANFYTASLNGVIDREPPAMLNAPQPADGILQLGDVISLTFNENIDPASILPGCITLTNLRTMEAVAVSTECYDNGVYLTPGVAYYWIENETLEASVQGLTDLHGNPMEEEVTWEFYVNANPVGWQTTKAELIKPLGEALTFTNSLVNTGGEGLSYSLDTLPGWLSASPMSGTLLPLDSQTVTFTVSSQIGFGHYDETLYADVPGYGREPLEVQVSVLADPPAWSQSWAWNYDYTMTVTGVLVIDGETSQDIDDIVGAFIRNDEGEYECRGVAQVEYVDYLDDAYQFFLTVYSNVESGDSLLLRVWDNDQAKEHYGVEETYVFVSGATCGTPVTPVTVHACPELVREIGCNGGWTWISTNARDNDMSLNKALASLSPADGDIIKGQTDYAQYVSSLGWVGALDSLATTAMYKVKLAAADTLVMVGLLEDPVYTAISYGSGWNWIGYLPHVSIGVGEALEGIGNLATGDIVKSQKAYAQYVAGHGWIGSLRFMNPGEGYLLHTANAGSFHYPDYSISRSLVCASEDRSTPEVPGWELNPLDYEYSANITAIISHDSTTVLPDFVVGAFVGGECRGISGSIEVLGADMYFLTLYANSVNETVTFKVYDPATGDIYDLSNAVQFVVNQVLGSPMAPYEFELPDMGLTPPQNVRISVTGTTVTLSWSPSLGATSYNVYSADDPNAADDDWSLEAEGLATCAWSAALPGGNRFYRVTAVGGYRFGVPVTGKQNETRDTSSMRIER